MLRLYVETNFLMSYATGRDPRSDQLFRDCPRNVQKVIPSCCLMEALSSLEDEQKRHNRQLASDSARVKQAERNSESSNALALATHLREVINHSDTSFAEFRTRLFDVIEQFSDRVGCQLIESQSEAYRAIGGATFKLDPTDHLILATILQDARDHPEVTKVFLSENHRCFRQKSEVFEAIRAADIRYFSSPGDFLEWHAAQAES